MSMIQSDLLLGQEGGAGYVVQRSLRFNSSDSAYLSRTPASAGNRKTWTWAGWVKRSALGGDQVLFGACPAPGGADNDHYGLLISGDAIWSSYYTGTQVFQCTTNAVLRDPSAWYHIAVAFDTTQATASNRIKIYVNGSLQSLSTASYPSLNYDGQINSAIFHSIGKHPRISSSYFSGYLADVFFIDSQALDPSSFVETSATTGQLIPKAYTGTFTGNSFWLKFADNSAATATTLGKDSSGLGNNWTPNNLSVTAGAGNDSLVDTPVSGSQVDTGLGGQVTGNYCTLNPLFPSASVTTNGNLTLYGVNNGKLGTMAFPSTGKWYYEVTMTQRYGNYWSLIGIQTAENTTASSGFFQSDDGVSGGVYLNGVKQVSVNTGSDGDICGLLWDADTRQMSIFRNGSQLGTTLTLPAATYFPWVSGSGVSYPSSAAIADVNFGQRPWAYSANASGAKALCDTNLPAPVVAKSSDYFQTVLYTGNGSTQTISGLGFSPDLVWTSVRDLGGYFKYLVDSVRGSDKYLVSFNTNAEGTDSQGITSLTSSGFTVGSSAQVNENGRSMVAWCFDAGTTTTTNTQGSITSQVRANPSAGFSVVTYTGTGTANSTFGHGLGVAPALIITKNRGSANDWYVYHSSLGVSSYLSLNLTAAAGTLSNYWSPVNSTVFGQTYAAAGPNNGSQVAYCFAPVAGYSSFGSYTGNGSADGPFVYTGFRPRWVMWKPLSSGTDWVVRDAARDSYNIISNYLLANSSVAEGSIAEIDFLSNGFKFRNNLSGNNTNGVQVIYACFAESPFQYARAR